MSRSSEVPAADRIRSQHLSLNREVARWRTWWEELNELGQPRFGEMGDRLARFRSHLLLHFDQEESLLSESRAEVARELPQLREVHARLVDELDQLIERLHACEPEFHCWGEARSDFEQFLNRLQEHEAEEERLLEQVH